MASWSRPLVENSAVSELVWHPNGPQDDLLGSPPVTRPSCAATGSLQIWLLSIVSLQLGCKLSNISFLAYCSHKCDGYAVFAMKSICFVMSSILAKNITSRVAPEWSKRTCANWWRQISSAGQILDYKALHIVIAFVGVVHAEALNYKRLWYWNIDFVVGPSTALYCNIMFTERSSSICFWG